jgi:hypothetical protein
VSYKTEYWERKYGIDKWCGRKYATDLELERTLYRS